ncbi:T9SS type A sorting domain-containing protein [bacterium]|nr:T9SS type A sorting domain-containing protein [bacterium]
MKYLICLFALMLLPMLLLGYEWELSIQVYSGDGTRFNTLAFGIDEDGTDGYDTGLDVPTFAPPSGFYAYFPLNDSLMPYMPMLGTDIRSAFDDSILWVIRHAGDFSLDNKNLYWNPELLPGYYSEDHYLYIGANYPGVEIDEWYPMDTMDYFEFLNAQEVHIKYFYSDDIDENEYTLQNYNLMVNIFPNPFNFMTNIEYLLCDREEVLISVYDLSGRKVIDLENGVKESGEHSIVWNGINEEGKDVDSGIYFCRIATKQLTKTNKIVIVK